VLHVRQQVVRLDGRKLVSTPTTGTSRRDLPLLDTHIELLNKQREVLGDLATVKDLVFPNEEATTAGRTASRSTCAGSVRVWD
jgi:hypothetical protein